ncbi:hypothetical protein P8631_13305 [Guyparkeria sp. 1SP6A2]|nr:hypothetical protein [Guyparkeria sp. 1SP6A2]
MRTSPAGPSVTSGPDDFSTIAESAPNGWHLLRAVRTIVTASRTPGRVRATHTAFTSTLMCADGAQMRRSDSRPVS